MFRPRIIPILLINNGELVKSIRFRDYHYIGDPVNAARIFSEMKADELLLLDISATKNKRHISTDVIRSISTETAMPLTVGGGISSLRQIENSISSGAEKVVIGNAAFEDPSFVEMAAKEFGSSTISVCVDVSRNSSGENETRYKNASVLFPGTVETICKNLQDSGTGEIILQSVNKDGTGSGYDLNLIRSVSEKLTIPVVAAGGAGNYNHFSEAYTNGASAVAAGSLFVFHRNGVLLSYPEREEINGLFCE